MENKSNVWNHQPVERFIKAFKYHYDIPLWYTIIIYHYDIPFGYTIIIYHYDIPLLGDYNYLVGGFNSSEKYESQLGWWHPIYEMENKSHVWNHQPVERFITAFKYHYDIPLLDDYNYLVGGLNPSEKNESQLRWWHPIYEMENKSHVWNHQPVERFITAFRYHYHIPLWYTIIIWL